MMNRVQISCFTLMIFLFIGTASGQTDYVINNDNVKIMGEVKSLNFNKVKFIPDGEKKVQKFNARQIKEAYKSGKPKVRSIEMAIGERPLFLDVLEDGKIKLYEYFRSSPGYAGGGVGGFGGSAGSNSKKWYAQKGEEKIIELKTNGIWGSRKARRDSFFNMIKDIDKVKERYEKVDKFNFDLVRSLIEEYNNLIISGVDKKIEVK
jgi:hypothetical protein